MYIFHTFFIHSPVEGRLGCLQALAITNNAAMHIVEQIFFVVFSMAGPVRLGTSGNLSGKTSGNILSIIYTV